MKHVKTVGYIHRTLEPTQTYINRRKRHAPTPGINPTHHNTCAAPKNPIQSKPQPKAPYSQIRPAYLIQNKQTLIIPNPLTSLTPPTPPPAQSSYSYYPQPCNKTLPPVRAGTKSPQSGNQAGGPITPCRAARREGVGR
jgi:hypothetical protein